MSNIIVEHGTTSDGLMAARVDGLAYIAIPLKEGFSIVSGCLYCRHRAPCPPTQRARSRRYDPARFHALGHVSIGDYLR